MSGFPVVRPRRLRQTPAMRALVSESRLHAGRLVLPMFVREGIGEPVPISSMPGVVQHSTGSLVKAAVEAVEAGVGGLMLFGVPQRRDAVGSGADDPDGILNAALREVVSAVGDSTVVMADLCLDEFTDHGHCGVLDAAGAVDHRVLPADLALDPVLHHDIPQHLGGGAAVEGALRPGARRGEAGDG